MYIQTSIQFETFVQKKRRSFEDQFHSKFQKINSETGYKIIQRVVTKKKNRNFRHDSIDSLVIPPFSSRSRLVFHSTVNGHDVAPGVETAIIRKDKKKKVAMKCALFTSGIGICPGSLRRSRAAKLTGVKKKKKGLVAVCPSVASHLTSK